MYVFKASRHFIVTFDVGEIEECFCVTSEQLLSNDVTLYTFHVLIDEVVGCHGAEVPLQLVDDDHFPHLKEKQDVDRCFDLSQVRGRAAPTHTHACVVTKTRACFRRSDRLLQLKTEIVESDATSGAKRGDARLVDCAGRK